MVETNEIQIPRKKMLGVLLLQHGTKWVSVCFVGIIVFCVLGFSIDLRFFILALMWICLIIPMLISFLFFFYGLNPITAYNTIPHKIIFSDNGLDLIFSEKDTEGDTGSRKLRDISLPVKELRGIKIGSDYILLLFNPPYNGWLWLPVSGVSSYDDFKKILNYVGNR